MDFVVSFKHVGLAVFAYLLGSIPWGLILARRFGSVDVRQTGSKNIGATNVLRTAGLGLGILTLIGDLAKGALPVWLAAELSGQPESLNAAYVSVVAMSAFGGHLYPVFLRFKSGGKGVATAAGCFLIISPGAMSIVCMFFILFAGMTKKVSAGSLAAVTVLPPAVWWFECSGTFSACAAVMAVFIYIRHRENIRRLISGTEPGIGRSAEK